MRSHKVRYVHLCASSGACAEAIEEAIVSNEQSVRILYTNYRGETALRRIVPERIHFGNTDWHPENQWLLDAVDVEKNAVRSFALKDIRAWIVGE